MKRTTIFINGRFLTKTITGVQRYAHELLRQIDLQLPPNIQIICLTPPEAFTPPSWENIKIRTVGRNHGNLWEQLDLPFHAHGELLFSPANIGPFHYRNQIVTLHDAAIFAVPNSYSLAFRMKYRFIFRQLAQNARHILTVSHFSQKELAHWLKISPQRFSVVPLGADHLDRVTANPQILSKYHLEKDNYLLVVASQSQHKNLTTVFQALQSIQREIQVVVTGGSFDDIFQMQKKRWMPKNIQTLGYVPDEALKALYENALGLIFPSAYEGFGLPILEAMRCGCPVLCSNAASMPEVAGDAAIYFDPHQPQQIVEVLNRFLPNPQIHKSLHFAGREQAKRFTWAITARQSIKILLRVANENMPGK